MAWPVYSTRFVIGHLDGDWTFYTVPAGKRAVVRGISAFSDAPPGAEAMVWLVQGVLWRFDFPVQSVSRDLQVMQVANEGEPIGVFTSHPAVVCAVSGHLLDIGAHASQRPTEPPHAEWPPGHEPARELAA